MDLASKRSFLDSLAPSDLDEAADLCLEDGSRIAIIEPRGRRRPVPIPGSEFGLPVDAVVAAVSQEPVFEGLDGLALDRGWLITGEGGSVDDMVWAGGDVLGLGIAGEAIVHGRRAAEAINQRLQGVPADLPDAEVSLGITEEQVVAEASRCFSCGECFGCRQCWMFCTPGCFTRVEVDQGVYFTVSLDACESCGKCIEVCPCRFLDVH